MCTLKPISPQSKGGLRFKACFSNSVSWLFSFTEGHSFKWRKNFFLNLPCGLGQPQGRRWKSESLRVWKALRAHACWLCSLSTSRDIIPITITSKGGHALPCSQDKKHLELLFWARRESSLSSAGWDIYVPRLRHTFLLMFLPSPASLSTSQGLAASDISQKACRFLDFTALLLV